MPDIWFSGDWHHGHKGIVRGESDWDDKSACRNFDTLKEHNETLIENINKCAKRDDILYCVGDVALGGRDSIYELMSKLNCRTIHLCLGNHDHHIRKNAVIKTSVDGTEVKAHSLFASVQDRISKKISSERFVLDHYSLRTWENGHNGSIMLYGHSHGSLPDYEALMQTDVRSRDGEHVKTMEQKLKFKTMDVGIDTHPEWRPYHIDEIKAAMTQRIPLRVDHHHHYNETME